MMHLIVYTYGAGFVASTSGVDETSTACVQVRNVSPPGGETSPEGLVDERQADARAWIKANYESPAIFILTQLDVLTPDISGGFLDIRGKASAMCILPGAVDIARNIVDKACTDIQEYMQELRIKAENKILQIWQENIGCLVVEATSSSLSETTSLIDEKPSPIGKPPPLAKLDGPSSPVRRRDIHSSPIEYSPKTTTAAVFLLQRQKEAARAFIDSQWDDFSGEPAEKILRLANSLSAKLGQRAAPLDTIPIHLRELVLSIIEKTNTEICGCMRALAKEADKEILKICEGYTDSFTS